MFNLVIGFNDFNPEELYTIPSDDFNLILLEGTNFEEYFEFLKNKNPNIFFSKNLDENKSPLVVFLDNKTKITKVKKNTIVLTTDDKLYHKAKGLITVSSHHVLVKHKPSQKETSFQYKEI